MDAKLQRRIQRYGWDKAVRYYEQYWGQQLAPAQRRLLEMAAIQPGEWVVDVACGTGLVTMRAAAAVGPKGVVVGHGVCRVDGLARCRLSRARGESRAQTPQRWPRARPWPAPPAW